MDAWKEMMDALNQARQWEMQLRYSLNKGQFTSQLAEQLEQTLRCQSHCRDKARQWQRAFEQGQPGQTDFPAARRLSEEYLAVQRDLALQLETIRQAAVQALGRAGSGGSVPAQFDSCRLLLDRLLQREQELCDLERDPIMCVETASVYAPPEYFIEKLQNSEKPSPSSSGQPYPQNFAVDPSAPDKPFPLPVRPVYAAPPRKEKK